MSKPQAYLSYRRNYAPKFFFTIAQRENYQPYFEKWDKARPNNTPVSLSNAIEQGVFRYFERTDIHIGFPPDWHSNALTGQRLPDDTHWSKIDDFSFGDIKFVWELSRFSFVYSLVRAYWRTSDERYAEIFWQLIEDWRNKNLPQQGSHWKCGQEISFRIMAWCFGLYGFLDAKPTTDQRVCVLVQMIAVSGRRIETNIKYALSQRNNHGISVGMGLWTIGVLFPELRAASKWRNIGHKILEEQGLDLIRDDGSFSQNSVNYHRLMLHDYVWSVQLGKINGFNFTESLLQRLARASEWLYHIQDKESGRVPYYGQNDGSLILRLGNCDYQDFRPIIQIAYYLFTSTRCYSPGPWDEDMLWLYGTQSLEASVHSIKHRDWQAADGGYFCFRGDRSFGFTRCATFDHRPGHADMLHFDLWWHGCNIALDAGTYSYNASPPWNNSLSHTFYHNTVTVDHRNQMERISKFLWAPWLQSRVLYHTYLGQEEKMSYWEGEHNGYNRLKYPVRHRRGILYLGDDQWIILDGVKSQGQHTYRLHWLFPDIPFSWDEQQGTMKLFPSQEEYLVQVTSLIPGGTYSIVRADTTSARGWHAPYYGYREPALSLALDISASSLLFWSFFTPWKYHVTINHDCIFLETNQFAINIHTQIADEHQPLLTAIRSISRKHLYEEKLCISF